MPGRHLFCNTLLRLIMKHSPLFQAATVTALLTWAMSSAADAGALPLPADPVLAALIHDSLQAVPELRRAEGAIAVEEARVPQVGALPDPVLQLGIQNDGFTSLSVGRMPMSFVQIMASQTFPWLGKRGLREDAAALDVALAKQAREKARLSIEAQVRRAYLDLLLVRDRMQLLDELNVIWDRSLGVARARYEAGDGAQSDVFRAQLERTRIAQRRFALVAQERVLIQLLDRLRGRPLDEAIATPGHIEALPPPLDLKAVFSLERVLSESPDLAAARIVAARADKTTALAKKAYVPDLTVSAGVMVRGSLPPMWVASVGGPLPVFAARKQARAVAESRAAREVADEGVAVIEQTLRLRSQERLATFEALLETLDLYTHGLLVQSEATRESTLSQYKVGRVSFASVLEANAGVIADREGFLSALADSHRLLIAEAEMSLEPVAIGSAVPPSGAMPGTGNAPSAPSNMPSSGAPAPRSAPTSGGSAMPTM